MSVSLIVTSANADGTPQLLVPLATEDVFARVWLRGAEHIGAQWLPLFQPGVELEAVDLLPVCSELLALRQWVESNLTDISERKHVTDRIDAAVTALQALAEKTTHPKIFIG